MTEPQPAPRPDGPEGGPGSSAPAGADGDADPRWALIRDVLVLQVKLVIEGLRDVMLGPISILAGLAGLLGDGDPPRHFHRVLRAACRFDDWIHLYGPLARLGEEERAGISLPPEGNVDRWFERVERAIVEQYEKGGITRSAKERIDVILDLPRPASRERPAPGDSSAGSG